MDFEAEQAKQGANKATASVAQSSSTPQRAVSSSAPANGTPAVAFASQSQAGLRPAPGALVSGAQVVNGTTAGARAGVRPYPALKHSSSSKGIVAVVAVLVIAIVGALLVVITKEEPKLADSEPQPLDFIEGGYSPEDEVSPDNGAGTGLKKDKNEDNAFTSSEADPAGEL